MTKKQNKSWSERFDEEFFHNDDYDCVAHSEGQICCLDVEHPRYAKIKSFIKSELDALAQKMVTEIK